MHCAGTGVRWSGGGINEEDQIMANGAGRPGKEARRLTRCGCVYMSRSLNVMLVSKSLVSINLVIYSTDGGWG